MLKAKLVPLYFQTADQEKIDNQVKIIKDLLSEEAEILDSVVVGEELPEADAVIFPQLVGEAYNRIDKIKNIDLPKIVITSEFGTVAMWDWEIITYMKSKGIEPIAPYDLKLTKVICRALKLKREMKNAKFVVFQDDPGDGMQSSIFKRFYWWEDECIESLEEKYGIEVIKESFKELGEKAKNISENKVEKAKEKFEFSTKNMSSKQLDNALQMYVALEEAISKYDNVKGVGINCLNESYYSNTTPCLAFNLLYEDKGILWGCEADIMSLFTEYIVDKSLDSPIMMSNVYPFLVGKAALKHEGIKEFPEVEEPENNLLIAHCGYFGLTQQSLAEDWVLRPRVLEIVNEEASAIDARIGTGDVTLTKIHPTFDKLFVAEGELHDYEQYPNSDCRNGGVIKINDGHKLMESLYSHHNCIIKGEREVELKFMNKVLNLETDLV